MITAPRLQLEVTFKHTREQVARNSNWNWWITKNPYTDTQKAYVLYEPFRVYKRDLKEIF